MFCEYGTDCLTLCYVPYHHVTPGHITRLPVRISRPDTTGMHPAARGMSGHFRKDLDNSHYVGTPSCAVGTRYISVPLRTTPYVYHSSFLPICSL